MGYMVYVQFDIFDGNIAPSPFCVGGSFDVKIWAYYVRRIDARFPTLKCEKYNVNLPEHPHTIPSPLIQNNHTIQRRNSLI